MSSKIALLSIGLALSAAGAARGQNLVQNPGFETGTLSGWTRFGEDTVNLGVWSGIPHSGAYSAYLGSIPSGGIQQAIAANVGDQVTVSFWYVSEGGLTPNFLEVTLGSVAVFSVNDLTVTDYQQFTGTFIVAEANPLLAFNASDGTDYLDVDDISVTINSGGPTCETADFNCDGDTGTDADIEAFFACVAGNCPVAPCNNTADFNGDGDVATDADIEAFFRVLSGNPC